MQCTAYTSKYRDFAFRDPAVAGGAFSERIDESLFIPHSEFVECTD